MTVFGDKAFTGGIKLKAGLRVGLIGVLARRGDLGTQRGTREERSHEDMSRGQLSAVKGEASGETNPTDTLIVDSSLQSCEKIHFYCTISPACVVLCDGCPGQPRQGCPELKPFSPRSGDFHLESDLGASPAHALTDPVMRSKRPPGRSCSVCAAGPYSACLGDGCEV